MQHTTPTSPPPLPPEFDRLRSELVFGIQSLMECWGIGVLGEEAFEDAITSIAEAVYANAMAELFERYPEAIAGFLDASEAALAQGDEAAFIRALAEAFPDFPEVFAHTAARLVAQTEWLIREGLAQELAHVVTRGMREGDSASAEQA